MAPGNWMRARHLQSFISFVIACVGNTIFYFHNNFKETNKKDSISPKLNNDLFRNWTILTFYLNDFSIFFFLKVRWRRVSSAAMHFSGALKRRILRSLSNRLYSTQFVCYSSGNGRGLLVGCSARQEKLARSDPGGARHRIDPILPPFFGSSREKVLLVIVPLSFLLSSLNKCIHL